jgi:hypothetical protein
VTLSIDVRNPRSGWIDVDLRLDERRFEMAVSDVANDPIRELAELALFIAKREPHGARATFWLEPAGYELSASRDPEPTLYLSYAERAFATLFPPTTLVLECPIDPDVSASEILRCLRVARPMFVAARATDPRAWRHPFPEAHVTSLADLVATE